MCYGLEHSPRARGRWAAFYININKLMPRVATAFISFLTLSNWVISPGSPARPPPPCISSCRPPLSRRHVLTRSPSLIFTPFPTYHHPYLPSSVPTIIRTSTARV